NKLILTEHDVPSVRLNYSSYKYIIKLIMKFLYRDKLVIGVSKKVKEDLKKNFKVKNAKFIYNGIDKEEIYILSEEAINEDIINKPYIISIGRLTTQKDFLTLIKAYSIALNKNIKENLIIIGDGEDKQKILKLIRELNLSDRVFLLGYKHNPYPYLKKAKLFILSSIWEGYGIALVEALVLGIPVISTNWLGASEILDNGKYGILVPSKDHKKMGEEIFNLLNHPEMLEVLKKKSRERGDFFSLQRMVNSYNEVFENLKYGKN
ncbi:MAG: glycosyltransferase, partial [candidate division WOR-3 bacterium]